jgi:hypothetical protein
LRSVKNAVALYVPNAGTFETKKRLGIIGVLKV